MKMTSLSPGYISPQLTTDLCGVEEGFASSKQKEYGVSASDLYYDELQDHYTI